MAENETLDLWGRHSGRWRRLLRKIEQDKSPAAIAKMAVRCLCKTYQNVIQLLSDQGLPLSGLLNAAARNDGSLHEMVIRCRHGRDYAELLEQLATVHHDPGKLLRALLEGTADRFLDQIGVKLLGQAAWPDTARIRILVNDVPDAMRDDVARLADRLARQPDVKPRMPGRSTEQKDRDHAEVMRTSLLRDRSGTGG